MPDPVDVNVAVSKLPEHPGWQALAVEFQRTRERTMARIGRDALAGRSLDQRDIDFKRGYFRAFEELFTSPDRALRRIEKEGEST